VNENSTGWRKSERSMANGNCVEVGEWRKALRSMTNGACVEVAAIQADTTAA
jgi:hypothetical protein